MVKGWHMTGSSIRAWRFQPGRKGSRNDLRVAMCPLEAKKYFCSRVSGLHTDSWERMEEQTTTRVCGREQITSQCSMQRRGMRGITCRSHHHGSVLRYASDSKESTHESWPQEHSEDGQRRRRFSSSPRQVWELLCSSRFHVRCRWDRTEEHWIEDTRIIRRQDVQ